MAKTTRHFKSMEAYKKYVAYGNIHKVFQQAPGNTPVKIAGKSHAVMHNKGGAKK